MRLLHDLCDTLGLGLGFAGELFLIVVVMLVHLALVLMKIKFVNPRRSDFEGFNVACLAFHYVSLSGAETLKTFLPLPLGEGWGEGLSAPRFAPSPNPSQREGKKPSTLDSETEVYATQDRYGFLLGVCSVFGTPSL